MNTTTWTMLANMFSKENKSATIFTSPLCPHDGTMQVCSFPGCLAVLWRHAAALSLKLLVQDYFRGLPLLASYKNVCTNFRYLCHFKHTEVSKCVSSAVGFSQKGALQTTKNTLTSSARYLGFSSFNQRKCHLRLNSYMCKKHLNDKITANSL